MTIYDLQYMNIIKIEVVSMINSRQRSFINKILFLCNDYLLSLYPLILNICLTFVRILQGKNSRDFSKSASPDLAAKSFKAITIAF